MKKNVSINIDFKCGWIKGFMIGAMCDCGDYCLALGFFYVGISK